MGGGGGGGGDVMSGYSLSYLNTLFIIDASDHLEAYVIDFREVWLRDANIF